MLNKSILLNINIVKSDMGAVIGLYITFLILLGFSLNTLFFPGTLLMFIPLIFIAVFYIKAINKICFSSFFDDEGAMYMTLPISARDMILGKVFAIAGFLFITQIIVIGSLLLMMLLSGSSLDAFWTSLSADLPQIQGSKVETTIVFGLLPISIFIENVFSASFMLTIFLKLGLGKKKMWVCWVIFFIMNSLIQQIIRLFSDFIGKLDFGGIINLSISDIIIGVVSALLIKYCIKNLEKKYNI